MSTLITKDTIQRLGYTVIGNKRIVQYQCVIAADDPTDMRIVTTKLDEKLYKENRDICRADLAAFEDAAYKLQEEYIAKMEAQSDSTESVKE
jgi:hypothetical protein